MNKDDLMPFCSTDLMRIGLNRPWSVGDYTVATNGHVLIRVPRLPDVGNWGLERAMPEIDSLPWDWQPAAWLPIPTGIVLPEKVACPGCCPLPGPGKCGMCDGTGIDDQEFDCGECDGSGKCLSCDGTGKVDPFCVIGTGGQFFQARYLATLYALPWCELGPNEGVKVAKFRFQGGDGMIMPCKPPSGRVS